MIQPSNGGVVALLPNGKNFHIKRTFQITQVGQSSRTGVAVCDSEQGVEKNSSETKKGLKMCFIEFFLKSGQKLCHWF